jgi:hypothetical protein
MGVELRWIASTQASCLHAAAAMLDGAKLAEGRTAELLAGDVEQLRVELEAMGLDAGEFFRHAVPQAARYGAPLELAEVVVTKIVGRPHPGARPTGLARRLIALQSAYTQAHPQAIEELETRSQPLREQWEARGPGLLAVVGRLTDTELLVEQAEVVLVMPIVGGGGAAHAPYNSVSIEAVLANPFPQLPEVARLAWLLAQLNLDLPKYQGEMRRERAIDVGRLAMIPPVLAAAQEVELARLDDATLAAAVSAWSPTPADPRTLAAWWETYQAENPPLAVAIGALDQMLQ